MKYVLIRDDDTCARTPVECLEHLYRPFLDRKLPVNLSVIPNVRTDVELDSGELEGYLTASPNPRDNPAPGNLPLTSNPDLVDYLKVNPEYHALHHGYEHTKFEFDLQDPEEASRRLDEGAEILSDAGFNNLETFVAPQDKISPASYRELVSRFGIISTGWFESRRMPHAWWPKYIWNTKIRKQAHWQVGQTRLMSHPGCLLSCYRDYATMLETVKTAVDSQKITVLVTHWWEYFPQKVDEEYTAILHDVAKFLDARPDIQVITFKDLANS